LEATVLTHKIKRTLHVFTIVVIIFVLIAVILSSALFWWSSKGVFSTSQFDPQVWYSKQTNESSTTCYRGSMAFDIRDNVLLKGMEKEQVLFKLGRPDSKRENEYQYTLGMCSGFQMDYDVLHIYFENGKLSYAKIFQH
jgi:hypothetical protein